MSGQAGCVSMRPVEVLLLNVHSSDNAGDAVLLEMALAVLREALPECRVTIAMNTPDPRYHRPVQGVEVAPSFVCATQPSHSASLVRRIAALVSAGVLALFSAVIWRCLRRLPPLPVGPWRQLLEQYAAANVVVSCPGNIFASTGKVGLPLVQAAITVGIALLMGKPLYVLPQSVGPLRKRWQRALVGWLYRRARVVMVREPVSLRTAQGLGIQSTRLHLVPDLAYAFPAAPASEIAPHLLEVLSGLPRPLVGVTVINRLISSVGPDVWDHYEQGMAQGLSRFVGAHGGSVVFFPQVTGPTEREDDRIAARRIRSLLPAHIPVLVLEDQLPPGVLKALYAQADLFVGTRMHSVIFATSVGVPTLCIEYLHKTRGLAEMMHLDQWRLTIQEITGTRLTEALDALWCTRDEVGEQLLRELPQMRDLVHRASELIRSDYDGA